MPPAVAGLAVLLAGAGGGAAFFLLSIPLPWVLGSFAVTGVLSVAGVPLRLPEAWRGYAMVVIGLMLGGGFNPEMAHSILGWWPSLLAMAGLSVLFLGIAYAILRKGTGMGRTTAILAGLPGGLSVVSAITDLYGADSRRVAISHTARLVSLLMLAPVMLHLVSDYDLTVAARRQLTFSATVEPLDLVLLTTMAVAAYGLAKISRLPSGLFMAPLILSAVVHASGLVEAPVPGPVSIVAQIVIGANIGTRFAGYRPVDILRDGWVATLVGVILAVLSLAAAVGLEALTGIPAAPLLLAFLPGGAPELGTVAVALNVSPAMVATHHFLRVMLIVCALPVLAALLKRIAARASNG